MNWKNFSFGRVGVLALFGVLVSAGYSLAEKSVWEKFKDFFNPGETVECESGPTCEEYRKIDSKINTLEGRFSRERRPVHKRRYKQELDSLNVIRDSLVMVIKGVQLDSLAVQSSSSATSSAAVQPGSSAVVQQASSAAELASSASESVVLSATEVAALVCKPDTVYVRDTVVVHDTLYVVVTNKPAETPASNSTNP